MPQLAASQPDAKASAQTRFAAIAGWLVAAIYFVSGIWLLTDDAWRYGLALWPDGPFGLPTAIGQSLTWLALASTLLFGLLWPTPAARRSVWLVSGILLITTFTLAGWWWAIAGVVVLHLLSLNPSWLPDEDADQMTREPKPEPLFYDGMCGLCHRWVKLVLHADPQGKRFYFSPLQGEEIKRLLTESQREALPDSIVIHTLDQRVLTKSDAVIHILRKLGGWYRILAILVSIHPRPIRDFKYDSVAKVRHMLFKKPDDACPVTPPEQRERFRF